MRFLPSFLRQSGPSSSPVTLSCFLCRCSRSVPPLPPPPPFYFIIFGVSPPSPSWFSLSSWRDAQAGKEPAAEGGPCPSPYGHRSQPRDAEGPSSSPGLQQHCPPWLKKNALSLWNGCPGTELTPAKFSLEADGNYNPSASHRHHRCPIFLPFICLERLFQIKTRIAPKETGTQDRLLAVPFA